GQPGVFVIGVRAVGDKAAADELDGQVEVVGKLLGLSDQCAVDLDAAGVELEHGGQTGDDAEAAAPFAEQLAGGQVGGGKIAKNAIGSLKVTGHKAGDAARRLKLLDAPIRL